MRSKLDTFFIDLSNFREAKNLESARVGQYCAVPANEFVQTTARFNHVNARTQPKVIGVAEDDFRVEVGRFQFFKPNAFHRSGCADRHEDRSFDLGAPRLE